MSYKLLQVSQLSALGVIGDDYLNYPLYKNDLLMATIGTQSASLSTAKVTIEELTQSIFQVGNTTSPWISADVGAIKRVYAPDFTYDGLVYEKKTWTYKKDIDVRNRTEVKAIKWKPKDAENRKLETIIPMRK